MEPELINGNIYLLDSYLFQADAVVTYIAIQDHCKHGSHKIRCNVSIFHPQGGGQASDEGILCKNGIAIFTVNFCQMDTDGICNLFGIFIDTPDILEVGDSIEQKINPLKRVLHIKLHSAGHILDAAIHRLGLSNILLPYKGYHFPDGPYVEYKIADTSSISKEEVFKDLLELINGTIDTIINEQIPTNTTISFPATNESEIAYKYYRVVEVANISCPCGGTHVRNTQELEKMKISRIKTKKDVMKISYEI